MPEWLGTVLSVFTGGGLLWLFDWWTRHRKTGDEAKAKTDEEEFDRQRKVRQDEIDLLRETISGLRVDVANLNSDVKAQREACEREEKEFESRIGKLRDEYTTALMENSRLRAEKTSLVKTNRELARRVERLEVQTGVGGEGPQESDPA